MELIRVRITNERENLRNRRDKGFQLSHIYRFIDMAILLIRECTKGSIVISINFINIKERLSPSKIKPFIL